MNDYSEHSDAKLWKCVAQNQPRAFDEIYQRYAEKVYQDAYRVLGDAEASHDLTQEVFVSLWTKRQTQVACLSSYLYGMTRNQVFKHLRRSKISRTHLARITQLTSENCTEQMVNLSQLQAQYAAGVNDLPARCREVFQLSRNEHLSTQEIANRLCISPKTVENQMTKALKHLRTVLRLTTTLSLILGDYIMIG